jgi:hypothetical protein
LIENFRKTFDDFKLVCDYLITAGEDFVDPFWEYDESWNGKLFNSKKDEIIEELNLQKVERLISNQFFISIYSYLDGLIESVYESRIINNRKLKKFLIDEYKIELRRAMIKFEDEKKRKAKWYSKFNENYFKYEYLLKQEYNKLNIDFYNDIEDDYLYFQKNRIKRNKIVHNKISGIDYYVDLKTFKKTVNVAEEIGIKILLVIIKFS